MPRRIPPLSVCFLFSPPSHLFLTWRFLTCLPVPNHPAEPQITEFPLYRRGKVRDVYDLGEHLLIVASDRISAFDVVLPTPVPDKGRILTQLSLFWFDFLKEPNHLVTADADHFPSPLRKHREWLRGRSMLVKKAERYDVECVVRGYLAGSGWKDYQKTGMVCGIPLPFDLKQCAKLAQPVFTPAAKNDTGHDENISFDEMIELTGEDVAEELRERSLKIYQRARDYAQICGVILADTKFEFGTDANGDGEIILIDEVLTPDSSRFWPAKDYKEGRDQKSFDKQYLRDWLETLDWNKEAPGPELPPDVVKNTRDKYLEAYRLLTGKDFKLD
jgi:phosphoribosylaminoimidazole-succinocarboxamide synthase